ncbi:NAD/NADP octopine/nopaline dehydrogenase [Clohesyomyces aquaticus]|uniref:NAD/NADP octopine/nopaline dehydrogenase n=1 Tax=Clohesyomyces aquaticus TaxID=1231657 RepID=A0A1Y2A331_9PLEO|nr:NAD/NADP octopine/nopaline dehydrogenase [Clohesyomyces aquaticus]
MSPHLEVVEMRPRISILGAGAAGLALALDLQNRGFQVLVYSHSDHLRHVNAIQKTGCLTATGAMQISAQLRFTTDMGAAIGFSSILILTVPSTGQETLLEELQNFALHRHTIIAIPGNLFSLVAKDLQVGCILETNLSPYSCRMHDSSLVVLGKKDQLFIAASHQNMPPIFYTTIESILPVTLKWCSSVIEVSLLNINGVFHPLMMIMNAGWIESTDGGFFIYRDGLTPAVANAMDAVDRVRMQVGEAFGLQLKSALEVSNECYKHTFSSLVDLAQNSGPHNQLKAPQNLGHRNLSEDVPDLLVTWMGLAEHLGIDASPIRAVVVLVSMSTGVDYLKVGRNLQKLRLEGVESEELVVRFSVTEKKERPVVSIETFPQRDTMIMSQL